MEPVDQKTKEIIAQARLELDDPDFDHRVMAKISRVAYGKVVLQKLLFTCGLILVLESTAFLLFWLFPSTLIDFTPALYDLPNATLMSLTKLGLWILENQYVIVPVIILLGIGRIVESRLKYS